MTLVWITYKDEFVSLNVSARWGLRNDELLDRADKVERLILTEKSAPTSSIGFVLSNTINLRS